MSIAPGIIALIATAPVLAVAQTASGPRVRQFELQYEARLSNLPPQAKRLQLWLPIAQSDRFQQITAVEVQAPTGYRLTDGSDGNRFLYLAAEARDLTVSVRFNVARTEHRQDLLTQRTREPGGAPSGKLEQYLRPDRLVPIDSQIRAWAQDVVDRARARTDIDQARAIYNHVVATVKYDKSGKGWGRGDIYYACESRRGNCTDFHAIFIGYCRALGIPARFAIGFPIPPDRRSGRIEGYHCWAEFYAKGIGWVPIDASEAAKDPSRRAYFFGTHDEHRLEFTRGRDVLLNPRQNGEPLNYFVYPYVELDGKPYAGIETIVAFNDSGK